MAEYNEQSGYIRQVDKPVSTYNAHQDEFGFKEGNENAHSPSGYGELEEGGAFDRGTSAQTQFGLEEKTGNYGRQGADPQLGETLDSAPGESMKSSFDKAPHGIESVPAGDGWTGKDISSTHGVTKDGLVNRIKKKLPGQHHLADGTVTHSDPNEPPKSVLEKVKETLPEHLCCGNAGT